MARERLVVIGGDAGGMSAASQARRLRSPDELEIVAFEKGKSTSYSACGIPYVVGGRRREPRPPGCPHASRSSAAKNQIDVHIDSEVTAIDLDRRAVQVNGDVLGTVRPAHDRDRREPGAPGPARSRRRERARRADARRRRRRLRSLEQRKPRTAVVVGSGYIGLEMAEAMVKRGLESRSSNVARNR